MRASTSFLSGRSRWRSEAEVDGGLREHDDAAVTVENEVRGVVAAESSDLARYTLTPIALSSKISKHSSLFFSRLLYIGVSRALCLRVSGPLWQ